jgi:hypothetical protein
MTSQTKPLAQSSDSTLANIKLQSCNCDSSSNECSCGLSSSLGSAFVYAIGLLRPVFGTEDLQQEYLAATKQLEVPTDDYYKVFNTIETPHDNPALSYRRYRYIAEKMCWVLSINNVDTFIVIPASQLELDSFIDSLQDTSQTVYSTIIGALGPIAPPQYCANMSLPLAICQYIDFSTENATTKLMLKPTDGTSDTDRAINFLACNFTAISQKHADLIASNKPQLIAVASQLSSVESNRVIIDISLKYLNSQTKVQSNYHCGIDVTDQYPFVAFNLQSDTSSF